jgi:hypothetical protein
MPATSAGMTDERFVAGTTVERQRMHLLRHGRAWPWSLNKSKAFQFVMTGLKPSFVMARHRASFVMAGLVPAIHDFPVLKIVREDVDARDKRGHDGGEVPTHRSSWPD